MLKWILKVSLVHRGKLFFLLFLQIGQAVLMSILPVFFQKIVSLGFAGKGHELIADGVPLLGMVFGIYMAVALISGIGGYVACVFSSDLLKKIQLDFFEGVCRLPLRYFQHRPAGEFMTQFNNDIGQTQGLICSSLPILIREFLTVCFSMLVLWWRCSVYLMGGSLLSVLLTVFLVLKLNGVLKLYALKYRHTLGQINQVFDETVQGIDTIKTFAGEPQVKRHFIDQTGILRQLSVRAGIICASFSPMIDLISKTWGLILMSTAYYLIAGDNLDGDQFLLFVFYAGLLQGALSSIIQECSNVQPQLVSAGNLFVFLKGDEGQGNPETTGTITGPVSIRTQNLGFSYPGSGPLFCKVDLHIPGKGITLIQGPSGSGKSTLVNLLLGFLKPDTGRIWFGNDPIGILNKKELRKKIGVVSQDHYIFHDSFRKNLSIANPDATEDDILAAVETAALGALLNRFPLGLDEVMHPRGKGLSGGEKQRVSMARVLLKNPGIIILDEPWANLDKDSRAKLVRVVNRCRVTTTVLILAHTIPENLAIDRVYKISLAGGIVPGCL